MSALEPTPIKFRWYIGVAAALFIFVVVGIYSSSMANDTDTTDGYDQQQAAIREAKLAKLQEADHKTLTTADWIDQDKGTVRIPIDEAMSEEVAALKAKPVAVGTAIPGAVPAAAAPAPAPTPPAANAPAPPPTRNRRSSMPLSPLHRHFTSSDPELAAVDASVRWPVMASLLCAVHWMVTGTVLLVYASSLAHPADGFPILDVFTWLSEHLPPSPTAASGPPRSTRWSTAGPAAPRSASSCGCSRAWAARRPAPPPRS